MNPPTNYAIADTLRRLALSELPDDHPRQLARQAVMEFRSNAQREGLATVNIHDSKDAPVLMRDDVIRASLPPEPAVKTRRGWLRRLFRRWVMGWTVGYDHNWKRDIGYGVPTWCDHPDCDEIIDRGLSYVCGGEAYGGENGCGLFFCEKHRDFHPFVNAPLCDRCYVNEGPFDAKPDHPDWINHKATDPSWAKWRAAQR